MVRSKIFENIRILRNSIIYDNCRFVSCNRSTMVYDKCRIMPSNVAFCNFMTNLDIRKPQGDSVKEPPCGFTISSYFSSAVTSIHWCSFGHFPWVISLRRGRLFYTIRGLSFIGEQLSPPRICRLQRFSASAPARQYQEVWAHGRPCLHSGSSAHPRKRHWRS